MKKNRLNEKISKGQYFLLAFLGVFLLIFLWAIVSFSGMIRPLFLPTPTAVLDSVVKLFKDLHLLQDIWISIYRIFLGFILSVAFSVPLGIYLGMNKKGQAFFEPIISFVRYIPPSAFVPLFILWFGIGEMQKILLIFAGVAPYLTLLVFDVVANTKKEYIEAAYTLGAKQKDIIYRVVIPQSLPGIWDAMRFMMGAAWTLVVLAEIIAATSGLGYLVIASQRFLRTSNVIAAIFIIGLLGLFTDLLFRFTYKKLFPWQEKL
ncbi:ABC transporter permease [Candidatus Falkowbacteria bacterium]|nr:ABC transporter permease [Candidatus Falkowbacteria bacterium]